MSNIKSYAHNMMLGGALALAAYLGIAMPGDAYAAQRSTAKKPVSSETATARPVRKLNAPVAQAPVPVPAVDLGLVVSSNKELAWAEVSVELLQSSGYENAYLMEYSNERGERFYRSVVPVRSASGIDKLKEGLRELRYFNIDDAFRVEVPRPEPVKKQKPAKTQAAQPGKTAAPQKKALEERVARQPTARKISHEEARASQARMTIDQYLSIFTPYVIESYEGYWRKDISPDSARQVLRYIYEGCREFNAPLYRMTALFRKESNFSTDAIGDKNLGENFSAGIGQTRLQTAQELLEKMRRKGIKNIPASFNLDDYLADGRLQVRTSCFYYSELVKKKGSDHKAALCYNAGPYTRLTKSEYTAAIATNSKALESMAAQHLGSSKIN